MTISRGASSATAIRALLLGPLLAIVCLALVAGPAPARSLAFSRPFTLGRTGGVLTNTNQRPINDFSIGPPGSSEGPSAAANDRGDLIVAWLGLARHNREIIQIAFRPAHRRFTRARTIFAAKGGRGSPRAAIGDPKVAIDGAGNALVVFTEFTLGRHGREKAAVVEAVYRLARGRLRGAQTLSPAGTENEAPAVAMAASGEAVVVFQRDLPSSHPFLDVKDYEGPALPDVVMAAVRAPGRPFGPAAAISPPAARQSESLSAVPLTPSVVIASSGEAIAAWSRAEHASVAIETSTRPPGGAFGPPSPIGIGDGSQPAVLAGDPSGDAVLAWASPDPASDGGLDASYRQAGQPFSTPQVLEHNLDFNGFDTESSFSATVDDRGTAAVLADVKEICDSGGGGLYVSRHPAGGEFEPRQEVPTRSADGFQEHYPKIVAYGPDRFISAWEEDFTYYGHGPLNGVCEASSSQLNFATASATSAFGRFRLLSRLRPRLSGYQENATILSLVANPSGLVIAVLEDHSKVSVRVGGPVR